MLTDELASHLRALLRDVLCGHLDSDLRSVAEDIIGQDAEPRRPRSRSRAAWPRTSSARTREPRRPRLCSLGATSSDGLHIRRVHLRVADLAGATAFYDAIVGPPVRDLVELRESDAPGPAPQRAAGLFHTAFLYPTRGQLGAALLRVARERAAFSGASDHLVSEALYLDDPDALGIELYRDRPRDTWPAPDPGERVKMDTLPLDLNALAAEAEGDATGVGIGHVHLKVADVEAATAFWTQQVGLELMTGWAGRQPSWPPTAITTTSASTRGTRAAPTSSRPRAPGSMPSCSAAPGARGAAHAGRGARRARALTGAVTEVAARGRAARQRRPPARRGRRRRACPRWRCSPAPARWPTPRWRRSRGRPGPRRPTPGLR